MSTESLVNKEAFAPEEPADFGERWRTGAVLLIVADASFVVALSFAFLYLRGIDTQASFHPGGTGVASLWWPWVVSAVMVASFGAYRLGLEAHEPGRRHFLSLGVAARRRDGRRPAADHRRRWSGSRSTSATTPTPRPCGCSPPATSSTC